MTTGTHGCGSNFLKSHAPAGVSDALVETGHTPLLSPSDTPRQTLLPRSVWSPSGGDTYEEPA